MYLKIGTINKDSKKVTFIENFLSGRMEVGDYPVLGYVSERKAERSDCVLSFIHSQGFLPLNLEHVEATRRAIYDALIIREATIFVDPLSFSFHHSSGCLSVGPEWRGGNCIKWYSQKSDQSIIIANADDCFTSNLEKGSKPVFFSKWTICSDDAEIFNHS